VELRGGEWRIDCRGSRGVHGSGMEGGAGGSVDLIALRIGRVEHIVKAAGLKVWRYKSRE